MSGFTFEVSVSLSRVDLSSNCSGQVSSWLRSIVVFYGSGSGGAQADRNKVTITIKTNFFMVPSLFCNYSLKIQSGFYTTSLFIVSYFIKKVNYSNHFKLSVIVN